MHLVFQGIDDAGNLTPSALRWAPSALAPPRQVYLEINRCARLVRASPRHVTLDLARPYPSPPR